MKQMDELIATGHAITIARTVLTPDKCFVSITNKHGQPVAQGRAALVDDALAAALAILQPKPVLPGLPGMMKLPGMN